jgi:hypothetical protein
MTFDKQLAIQCAKSIACLYDGFVAPNVVAVQTDTEALIEEHHDGRWAIIFPGTASRADWITDFKFRREAWFAGSVHRGFKDAYLSVNNEIVAKIPQNSRVIVAGHSLGGALATLCAHALKDLFKIEAVYTFGSPRVGNGTFQRDYNCALGEKTFRLFNAHDPVPYVPPWLFGNRHVSTEAYLDEEGGIVFDRSVFSIARDRTAGILARASDDVRKQIISVGAHYISRYIAKLEALA